MLLTSRFRTIVFAVATGFIALRSLSVGNYSGILIGLFLVAMSYYASRKVWIYWFGVVLSLLSLVSLFREPSRFISASGAGDQILIVGGMGAMAFGLLLFSLHPFLSGRHTE